jgi:hypothetical protein
MQRFAREQLLLTAAIIVKKSWLDWPIEHKNAVFYKVQELGQQSPHGVHPSMNT